MLYVCLHKRRVQSLESCAHSFWLIRSYAKPEQLHSLGEYCRISKHSVVVGLGIEFSISEHEHPARSTETANVRKEIQMIQRDLERLHATQNNAAIGAQ